MSYQQKKELLLNRQDFQTVGEKEEWNSIPTWYHLMRLPCKNDTGQHPEDTSTNNTEPTDVQKSNSAIDQTSTD